MKPLFLRRHQFQMFLALMVGLIGLSGCGESEKELAKKYRLMDEAFEVGFAMGLAERCGIEHSWSRGVPSQYDDSLNGKAEIGDSFKAGYSKAKNISEACIHGIEGR